MHNKKTFLAIIPARGGSKRLPHKNILDLSGKPLIAWTIEAAKKSQYLDTIVVSSDDEEILEISTRFGAETLKRPEILSNDAATTFDALKHAIDHLPLHDFIVLLQPTSPLRTAQHIDEAINLLFTKNADAIISVCETDHHPLWSNILTSDGDMSRFIKDEIKNVRSQDLPTYYRINGAIYICKMEKLLKEKSFMLKDNIFAYRMNRESSIDIDEEIDFKIATVYSKQTL